MLKDSRIAARLQAGEAGRRAPPRCKHGTRQFTRQLFNAMGSMVATVPDPTQQNSASAAEPAASAGEMCGQAEQLQRTMGFFKAAPRRDVAPRAALRRPGHGAGRIASLADLDEANFTRF